MSSNCINLQYINKKNFNNIGLITFDNMFNNIPNFVGI